MTRYAPILALLLCTAAVCHAQGGNCEPPTPEEAARMQEMRRSSVAPVTEVRFGGSGFRGTNRKPAPTRREAELAARVDELERQIAALIEELRQAKEGK